MATTFGNTDRASGVIKHELAHLVGLGHVHDTGQLMNAESTAGAWTYQDGDLAGLAVLGQGKCRPGL